MPLPKIDFSHIPDSTFRTKRNDEIQALVGCSMQPVRLERERRRIPSPGRKPGSGRRAVIDISKFHAGFTNTWNAKRLGCSLQWAGKLRAKLLAQQTKEDWDL